MAINNRTAVKTGKVEKAPEVVPFNELPSKQQAIILNLGVIKKLSRNSESPFESLDELVVNSQGNSMTLRAYLMSHCRRMMRMIDPECEFHTELQYNS